PTAASPLDESRVFAGLEGANEGLLLIDGAGRVLGGALRDRSGADVTDAVAAYLAGVSQEAARTAKLLGLGAWTALSAEGQQGNVHIAHPTPAGALLVVPGANSPGGGSILVVAVAEPDVNIGLVRLELLRVAEKVI